jgi:hypothetical protein
LCTLSKKKIMAVVWTCVDACLRVGKQLAWAFVGAPTFHLYLHGPGWAGGWKSRPREDICASLTTVEADFWQHNPLQCEDLIYRDFHSVYALVQVILYVWLFLTIVHGSINRFMSVPHGLVLLNGGAITAAPICDHSCDR